jgi:hypothetical protein
VSLLSSFLELPMLSMILLSLLVSWQKLSVLGSVWHLPPAGSWWNQLRCDSSCSLPYMLLLKFTEHVGDCHCCSNHSWLFSLFVRVGSHFLFAVHWFIVESDISITYSSVVSQFYSGFLKLCYWRSPQLICRYFFRVANVLYDLNVMISASPEYNLYLLCAS